MYDRVPIIIVCCNNSAFGSMAGENFKCCSFYVNLLRLLNGETEENVDENPMFM